MHKIAPDDPSVTPAGVAGRIRMSLPLISHREPQLTWPLYVRPRSGLRGGAKCTPEDRLIAGVIHVAVRRIKTGGGEELAVAPLAILINLSLAGETPPFARITSPDASA
jgi:hypothetical protein